MKRFQVNVGERNRYFATQEEASRFVSEFFQRAGIVLAIVIRKPKTRVCEPIPRDWPVRPIKPGTKAIARATCGHCGLSWDDDKVTSMTPAPSGRCPFEMFHIYPETQHEEYNR